MADKWCSTLGNDTTGDGSEGNPYATPQKCLTTLSSVAAWDTNNVYVVPDGTYVLTSSIVNKSGTNIRSSVPGTKAVLDFSTSGGSDGIVNNAVFARQIDLDIRDANVWGIDSNFNANINVTDCIIRSCTGGGVNMGSGAGDTLCQRVIVDGCGGTGIQGSSSGRVEACEVRNHSGLNGITGLVIENCVVAGNTFSSHAYEAAGATVARSCIAQDNTTTGYGFPSSLTTSYCNSYSSNPAVYHQAGNFQGGAGANDIEEDSQFTDLAGDDFTLQSGSPCIGAGDPASTTVTDLAGNEFDSPPSQGAYEFLGGPTSPYPAGWIPTLFLAP